MADALQSALGVGEFLRQGIDRLARAEEPILFFVGTGAGLIALIFYWPRWHWMSTIGKAGLDTTVIAIGTCMVMLASVLGGGSGRCWTYPIRWFGRCSYEVYLTHEFIVVWGTALWARLHRGPVTAWIVGMLLLTAPVGWTVATFFSEPLNRRLRKLRTEQNVPAGGPAKLMRQASGVVLRSAQGRLR